MALDANINRLKFVRTKTAGKAPSTTDIQEGELAMNLVDKTLYGNDGSSIFRFGDPDRLMRTNIMSTSSAKIRDVTSSYTAGNVTGALVINLPKSKFNSATMMKITVEGYNYEANSAWKLELSGYNYTGRLWVQCSSTYTGPIDAPFIKNLAPEDTRTVVKFGTKPDRNIIVIGAANTVWSYPNITVSEVLVSRANSTNGGWDTDWALEYVSDQATLDGYSYSMSGGVPLLSGDNIGYSSMYLVANEIRDNTDLNNLTIPGTYRCRTNTSAGTIVNRPGSASAFSLFVEQSAYTSQTLTFYNNGDKWTRQQTGPTTWTTWRQIAYTDSASTGNAATASKWSTPTTFNFTGDTTGTVTFDGSETVKSIPLTTRAASTTQAGIVQLFDGQSSTSTTMALTANQGKVLADAINTKVDKINPTSSGTLTHTGGATVSGDIIVSGSLVANRNIQNTTGSNLSFLNGGSALGINVGNILVSNNYAEISRVPPNGAFIKGGLEADAVITGKVPVAYSTIQQIGVAGGTVFRSKDVNIGTSYGFTPILSWNIRSNEGYRQVNHIGGYRPGSNWSGAGIYIAPGGGSDAYANEAFLFQNGRTISNTAGPVLVKGISDYANNIDATTGSLYGNTAIGWRKLGIANIPQNGRALMLSIFGGTGFNSPGNPQQAMPLTIILKSGNNSPKNLNMVVHAHDTQNLLANLGPGVANACYVPVGTGDDYEIWINSVGFLSANLVAYTGALTSWTQDFTPAPVAAKPTGAIDARIFTIANTNSNVASADKLSTPRTINGVNFDGTSNIGIQQQSVSIPSNADLDTYLTEGFYYCDLNVTAQTIQNGPVTGSAFCLLVERTAGVKQTFTIYSPGSSRTWIRNIYGGVTGAWREVAYTDNTTLSGVTKASRIESFELYTTGGGINNQGKLTSGDQTELGTVGTNTQTYIDFHSGPATNDYDTRIISTGGATAAGNGALSYIAASHTFNGSIGAGIISASSVSVSTGLGIANSSNTVLAGLSLYGGAQSGKPNYGITFTGTGNAGTGKHGDLDNALWATYLTCATSGAEKRGWIFQRSDNNTNVASISTNGVLSTNGNIQTLNDNTMIKVGNNNDLALVKKVNGNAFVGVGANTGFAVKRSNASSVDPSNTFTDLLTVRASGDLDITGNNVYIGNGINQNTYETIQFGNYTKATGGGGFSVIQMMALGSPDGRVLQLANYTEAGAIASALYVSSSGTYQTVGTTTLKLATIADNVASATKLQTPRTIGGVSFDGTANINLPGVNITGNQSTTGNAATATVLQTARLIGGVSFDGSADINLPGVNIEGNQNTTGNAATATVLQTARNFSISGAVTSNTVPFNGNADVNLQINTLDGSKVSGTVAYANIAQRAQSVDIAGNQGAKLVAQWTGAVFGLFTRNLVYASSTTLTVEIGGQDCTNDMTNNFRIGSTIHMIKGLSSNSWQGNVINATVLSITSNRSTNSLILTLDVPGHGLSSRQAASYYFLGATYTARGCYFLGTVSSEAKGTITGGDYSYLIRTITEVTNPSITGSVSGDVSLYHDWVGYGFLKESNPCSMSTTMVNGNTCNFVVSDNNNDAKARTGMVTIQIWDAI